MATLTPNQLQHPVTFEADTQGHVTLGGVDVNTLVETYGTPLYVMDEATIRQMASVYKDTLKAAYPEASLVLYACKANISLGLCKLAQQESLGLDVVSGGELYTALQAGFPPQDICFNGNNKSVEELTLAIHHKVGRIIVDNLQELERIHEIASKKGVQVEVLLRVTPGIECHTHEYIQTGHLDTKFGFDLAVLSAVLDRITGPYKDTIILKGLHAHIGSQIFEDKPYQDLARLMLNVYYNIRQNYDGLVLTDLNLGGGLGVAYSQADTPLNVSETIRKMAETVKTYAESIGFPLPRLLVEPGRSLVATSGVTIYTVGGLKQIPDGRKYVSVDGGMGDNIRPALYQAEYSAMALNKPNNAKTETVRVAGKYCESGDVVLPAFTGPELSPGDHLMVFGTGAYNYSMASNYNRIPRPAVVLVSHGEHHVLVERETYDTLIQQDRIPAHLL